jgi:hypothetical protein
MKHSFIVSHFWSSPELLCFFSLPIKGLFSMVFVNLYWMDNFDIHLSSDFTLLRKKKIQLIHMDAFYLLPNLMVTNGT